MVETMVMMSFLLFIIFGFMQLCLLCATKSMVNLAAFSAARTILVRALESRPGGGFNEHVGWPAAWQVLDTMHWWNEENRNAPDWPLSLTFSGNGPGQMSGALGVTYRVPLGLPLLNGSNAGGGSSDGLPVITVLPLLLPPNIPEVGDNADPPTGGP